MGGERMRILLGTRAWGSEWLRTEGQGSREMVGGRKTFQLSLSDPGTGSFVHLTSQNANLT